MQKMLGKIDLTEYFWGQRCSSSSFPLAPGNPLLVDYRGDCLPRVRSSAQSELHDFYGILVRALHCRSKDQSHIVPRFSDFCIDIQSESCSHRCMGVSKMLINSLRICHMSGILSASSERVAIVHVTGTTREADEHIASRAGQMI